MASDELRSALNCCGLESMKARLICEDRWKAQLTLLRHLCGGCLKEPTRGADGGEGLVQGRRLRHRPSPPSPRRGSGMLEGTYSRRRSGATDKLRRDELRASSLGQSNENRWPAHCLPPGRHGVRYTLATFPGVIIPELKGLQAAELAGIFIIARCSQLLLPAYQPEPFALPKTGTPTTTTTTTATGPTKN